MDGTQGKEFITNYFKKSDPVLVDFLRHRTQEASEISKVTGELLKRFSEMARLGKRVRGSMVTLGYQLAGGKDEEAILPASLAAELFHAAALVHDDIMDNDDIRRGLPTVHSQFREIASSLGVRTTPQHYGESMGINAGDAALYLSWQLLLSSSFSPENILAAGKIYADYVVRVVYGQALDVTNEAVQSLTERDVLKVLRYKTAEYTGVMPTLMGAALAGGVSPEVEKAIIEYGLCFGWAFQIQDDYLGLYGTQEKMGKPIGSDLEEGKNTLFMLHLSQHGTREDVAFQQSILGTEHVTEEQVKEMREILDRTGSTDYVLNKGWEYVEKAKEIIPHVTSDTEQQELLESLLLLMMERTK